MTPEMRQKLREVVLRYQKYKQYPYIDFDNILKIGFDHNLERNGISINQALEFLSQDLHYYTTKLNQYLPRFLELSEPRQVALIALCHFIGWQNVLDHSLLLETIDKQEYDIAAAELIKLGYVDLAFLVRSNSL